MLSPTRTLTFAILLLIASVLPGCALFRTSSPSGIEHESLTKLPTEKAEKLIQWAREIETQPVSYRALYHVVGEKGVAKESVDQVVVFQRPDKLRVEFFAPGISKLLSLIVVRDDALSMLDNQQRKYYIGAAVPSVLERVLSVPFSPEESMLWLSGRAKLPEDQRYLTAYIEPNSGRCVLQGVLSEGRTILLSVESTAVGKSCAEALARSEKAAELPLRYSGVELRNSLDSITLFISTFNYETTEAKVFPKVLTFWLPKSGEKGELTVERSEINPDLSALADRLFYLKIPENGELFEIK